MRRDNLVELVPIIVLAAAMLLSACAAAPEEVKGIELDRKDVVMRKGESITLTPTLEPENAEVGRDVTWSSDDSMTASVEDGVVTARKPGNATITARTSNGKEAFCRITVKRIELEKLVLNSSSIELSEEDELTLSISRIPEDAEETETLWSSSDNTVASVENGHVRALKEGVAIISAEEAGIKATCTVKVKSKVIPVTSVTITPSSIDGMYDNRSRSEKLKVEVLPENATYDQIIWKTSDSGVATVSQNGSISSKRPGEAIITAEAGGVEGSCTIRVVWEIPSWIRDRTYVATDGTRYAFSENGILEGMEGRIEDIVNDRKEIVYVITNGDGSTRTIDFRKSIENSIVIREGGKELDAYLQEGRITWLRDTSWTNDDARYPITITFDSIGHPSAIDSHIKGGIAIGEDNAILEKVTDDEAVIGIYRKGGGNAVERYHFRRDRLNTAAMELLRNGSYIGTLVMTDNMDFYRLNYGPDWLYDANLVDGMNSIEFTNWGTIVPEETSLGGADRMFTTELKDNKVTYILEKAGTKLKVEVERIYDGTEFPSFTYREYMKLSIEPTLVMEGLYPDQ